MERQSVAVVGASGYSGEELIRILLGHPQVELTCVTSRQYAGKTLGQVFPRYAESRLLFTEPDPVDVAERARVAFLALPHGLAGEYALPLLEAGVTVLDISADFRLRDPEVYRRYYGTEHPAPALLRQAVYGMPEFYRKALRDARLVACPGCYPTSAILPLRPLLASGQVRGQGITLASMSGVSGAGRKVDLPYLFPECNESLRAYGVVGHRHTPEIEQELAVAVGGVLGPVSFIPHLVPVNRGIHTTVVAEGAEGVTVESVHRTLIDAYEQEPFVRVLPPGSLADTKHVTMTNMCEIGCAFDQRTGRVILSSAIDNLTKGASGQAVQCMNIVCGFAEGMGLV
jgi:N-acetyl-gamma-glutamyl-phosphate reductase